MARQDRWRNEERSYGDIDRDRSQSGDDYRYRSESRYGSSGSDYGRGSDRFGESGRSDYRSRSDYDYGGSDFNRGDRSGSSHGQD